MKAWILALHKYTGLALALLLAVVGASGSLLVFYPVQDAWLTPALRSVPGEARPLSEIVSAARQAMQGAVPARVDAPKGPALPYVVRFAGPEGAPGPIQVAVAPATAEVLAIRQWGEYPMSWVYRLHYTLLAGTTGKYVVGASGLCLLFFCFSGLYLWWPRAGRWRRAFTVRGDLGAFRLHFDLHRVVGVVTLVVMVVVAFSGVALVFREPVQFLVSRIMPMEAPLALPAAQAGEPLALEQLHRRAQALFPDAALVRVDLPARSEHYRFIFRRPGEGHGGTGVWMSPQGQLLHARDGLAVPLGSRFMDWQFPLHNGAQFGLAGRWLVFLSGWVLVMLCWTGVYLWWKKARLRRQARRR